MNEMLNVVVDGLWCQGDRSLAVRLVSASGEPLPGWEPGAHIDVHLPCGLIRQYSLTGDNRAGSYLICVAQERASRGGSRYIHQTLRPGQRLLISAPRNLFALRDDGPVLLLAAGIGITPLYAMLLQREATGRPFVLHYFVKRREEAAFLRELSRPLKHGICVVHCSAEGRAHVSGWRPCFPPPATNSVFTPVDPRGLWRRSGTLP
jgi:vanillate O-demethylase ferredoxin subunit